jgi:signal transduction histidine kinase
MDVEELRGLSLLDGLTDEQLDQLNAAGEELSFGPGDELFHELRPADDWWLLLEGSVTLLRHVGREEAQLGVMGSPGQWAGGFQAWDTHGVYLATGRASTHGRLFRVPAPELRRCADTWFPFGGHLIAGVFQTARSIESMARQREALVALGTLAAGLAHEINNPASSATRAVDALERADASLLGSLIHLAEQSITAEQFMALDRLRQEIEPPAEQLDSLALADREEALTEWLLDHGVEQEWQVAPPLAAAGVGPAWCERVQALLGDGAAGAGVTWVADVLSTSALLAEVKSSTRRISELVAAVRSYSQLDRATMQPTSLADGLESTLVMLEHKLKGGIHVVRDYGVDVPTVEASAGELNQVWTNLIDNAVDAMEGSGTLRITIRSTDEDVVVEIADTGPGVPEEVQAHVFEPFFTTKEVGKGTGLGLDICRRIVAERHGGEISIHSGPGGTVMRVRIPRSHPVT